MNAIYRYFINGFEQALSKRVSGERRIGAELKFPLVTCDGSAAPPGAVDALWRHLTDAGWTPEVDTMTGAVVGARLPGEQNDTLASCETGYCKTEFSLAHVKHLFKLEEQVNALREELKRFAAKHKVLFLGYGIHPVSPPGKTLLMKKLRTSVWDQIFPSNRHIPLEHGDDFHLFTVNAASHVHVSADMDEAVPLVNVLNGFAGAQIALTANSNIWRGKPDENCRCVAEKFWDWWLPESGRVGVPEHPFSNIKSYIDTISAFRPVFVKRDGNPVLLTNHDSFVQYYECDQTTGVCAINGHDIPLEPHISDIDIHSTCYWYNARISRYYTVENRVNDQQPPEDLLTVAAITLGLASALPEAANIVKSYDWEILRKTREVACYDALSGICDGLPMADLARQMLTIAETGLRRRNMGEEVFLDPLKRRIANMRCPADDARTVFDSDGIVGLLQHTAL